MEKLSLERTFPPAPTTTRGQGIHIGADKKGEKICYPSGQTIVVRSLTKPDECDLYTGHAHDTTVAKFSPSGYYIASGDVAGWVKIWASKRNEDGDYILKAEYQALSGAIKDLAWSPDNQRMIAVGDGKDSFCRAFLVDSGATVGEIGGHGARVNSCDFKSSRPFRVVTCGDDKLINVFNGPPFKFAKQIDKHTNSVNCVRYSPAGDKFVAVSSDKTAFVYDGKTGDEVGQLKIDHKGSVYTCCWSPDGSQIMTASADKTVKVFNAESGDCVQTYKFADKPTTVDMQVGCVWAGEHMVSVNLNGDIFFLDPANPDKPKAVWPGHKKTINGMCCEGSTVITADNEGRVIVWDTQSGIGSEFKGKNHDGKSIKDCDVADGMVYTVGGDQALIVSKLGSSEFGEKVHKFNGMPVSAGLVCATSKEIALFKDGALVTSKDFENATCSAVSPNRELCAIGTSDAKVHLFSISSGSFEPKFVLEQHKFPLTALSFSADNSLICTADKRGPGGNICLWDVATGELKQKDWVFHNAAVQAVTISPSQEHVVSGGLDNHLIKHKIDGSERAKTQMAHSQAVLNLLYLDASVVVSSGAEFSLKLWKA